MLYAKILDDTFSEHDAKPYVAFSSSLARTLAALGVQPAAAKPSWIEPLYEALDGVTGKIAPSISPPGRGRPSKGGGSSWARRRRSSPSPTP